MSLSGITKIYEAANNGDLKRITALIAVKTDVNAIDAWTGETSLHKAAKNGYITIIEALIDAKANLMFAIMMVILPYTQL